MKFCPYCGADQTADGVQPEVNAQASDGVQPEANAQAAGAQQEEAAQAGAPIHQETNTQYQDPYNEKWSGCVQLWKQQPRTILIRIVIKTVIIRTHRRISRTRATQ